MRLRNFWLGLGLMLAGFAASQPAGAEWQAGVYGGYTLTHNSDIDYSGPALGNRTFFDVRWKGEALEMPPYYGLRLTRWFEQVPGWGVQVDFSHTKAAADLDARLRPSFSRLEFTNGLNIATLNGVYRWAAIGRLTPYAGAGLGIIVPHVEVTTPGYESTRTFEYQLAGMAAVGFGGVDFAITDSFSVFGEYKLSYSRVEADLVGGGTLSTDLVTHHFNLGLNYRFDLF